jgi:hypothetical protein
MRKLVPVLVAVLLIAGGRVSATAQHYHDTGRLNTWTMPEVSRLNGADGQFRILRVAKHKGFDRAVFEFADGVSTFSVSYQEPPIYQEETMTPVELRGSAVLVVSFRFYYGEKVDIYKGFPKGELELTVLREVKVIDSSEGQMSYALGLQGRHAFRVSTLANPARLVVDIKH